MENFIENKKIGLILRIFSSKIEDLPNRLQQLEKIIFLAKKLKIGNKSVFSRIDVLVWGDQRFSEKDCGKTFDLVSRNFKNEQLVFVHDFKNGDIFCSILNYGVATQLSQGISHSCIASVEVASYFSEENFRLMIGGLYRGALAVGLALNELQDLIMAGRLANTLCIWDNLSLLSVGGFDLKAEKSRDEKSALYIKGWNEQEKKNLFYELAGVEEIIPLARMIENFGPCVLPIMPVDSGCYKIPDKFKETELYFRHLSKMATKVERQNFFLNSIGYDSSYLLGGIIKL